MNPIKIRKATIADIPKLLQFEQGVILAERPFDATLKKTPIQYYDLEYLVTSDKVELLVAVIGDELIGSGYGRIENAKPYLQHTTYAYLGFMYVDPLHRGKGINKQIIKALVNWCMQQNITELRLDVYENNKPAITAYEKVGFAKHMIEMRMGLNDNEL